MRCETQVSKGPNARFEQGTFSGKVNNLLLSTSLKTSQVKVELFLCLT